MSEELKPEEREAIKAQFGLTDAELDEEIEKANSDNENVNAPMPGRKDDILLFLRDIFGISEQEHLKMNRTGNLNDRELGNLVLSVRSYNDIANYAETEEYPLVATYLRSKSNNVITTSTSKKGFFLQLITTSKKISKNIGSRRISEKSSLFGGTQRVVEGGDEE